jgi:hypothetical protein
MKNDPPKYLKKLEDRWKSNKRSTDELELSHQKGLRGPDLVHELMRLSAFWKDPRFEVAADALFEHRIVDKNLRFTGRELEAVKAFRQKSDAHQLAAARFLMVECGMSEHRACLEVAAAYGRPAASLTAAAAQLKNLARDLATFVRTRNQAPA